MKIAILGAGAYGTALGGVLADKGYDIDYYDTRLERERLADVVAGARYVVLCVPSSAAPHVLPHLPKDKPLIVATKGILTGAAFATFADWMVVSGPGFAEDLKAAKPTHLTATDARAVGLFGTEFLDFDQTDDRQGVLMCGALKNVYAVLAGMRDLQRGVPEHGKFLSAAADEMRKILAANGADSATVDLSCGVGDLRLTCGLPSRNYEFGQKLRRDAKVTPEKTVEGLAALKRIRRGEIKLPEGLPLMEFLLEESKKWQ